MNERRCLTLVFRRQRERLRYKDTRSSLKALSSSPNPSLGNFLKAYWYRWAASFIFPLWERERESSSITPIILTQSLNISWIKAQRFDKTYGDQTSIWHIKTHLWDTWLLILQYLWNYAKLFSHSIHPISLYSIHYN